MMTKRKRRYYPAQSPKQSSTLHRTLIFCKPCKVLTAFTDPEGRPALGNYIDVPNVYAAGRLDYDSEGLLLLTSDGQLAHRITHPRYKLDKVYLAQVEYVPDKATLDQLGRGVIIKEKQTRPAQVQLLATEPEIFPRSTAIRYRKNIPTAWLKIILREGRKRQVRRMTAAVGHPTLRLIRMAIGPIILGNLAPGQWRDLTKNELKDLRRSLGLTEKQK